MRTRTQRSRGLAALAGKADVLVVTADTRTGIAAARSLRRNDIPFVVIGYEPRGLIAASRHVERRVVGPSTDDPAAFIAFLGSAIAQTGASLVLPIGDEVLRVCNDHRGTLAEAGATLAAAAAPAVEAILDKRANLDLAERLGIPCPASFTIDDSGQIPELIERIGFPMVLKPATAYGLGADREVQFKWLVAHDERELRSLIERHCGPGRMPIFQELVVGHVVGLYCFAAAGELIAIHAVKALRRSMGQNVYREIIAVDPRLAGYAKALLRELAWDGVAALAFFVTPDGDARYMETNGRLWGSIEGTIHAGWDMPYWIVRYFRDGVVPDPPPIAIGSKACWRFGDLVALYSVWRGEPWLTDRSRVGRVRAALGYLACFRPGVHSDVFRLDDPMPELTEHWLWLRELLRRRRGRRAAGGDG